MASLTVITQINCATQYHRNAEYTIVILSAIIMCMYTYVANDARIILKYLLDVDIYMFYSYQFFIVAILIRVSMSRR